MRLFTFLSRLSIGLFLFCCSTPPSEDVQSVYAIIDEAFVSLTKKHSIRAAGTAIAMPDGIVKELGLHFQVKGPLPMETLRRILIESAQEFHTMINANMRIRPHLEEYPFGMERIEIVLFMIDMDGRIILYPYISNAEFRNGRLMYEYETEENGILETKKEIIEPYAEALKALDAPVK